MPCWQKFRPWRLAEAGEGAAAPPGRHARSVAWSTPGGAKKCWFRNLSDVEAKKRATQLMSKLGKMNTDEVLTFLGTTTTHSEE